MPVHDWTRVPAGIFHHFHSSWIGDLSRTLNRGVLPPGFYALAEQQAGLGIADILTLQTREPESRPTPPSAIAVAEAPPRVGRRIVRSEAASYRTLRRTLAVRHVSGHRLVAMVEIVSPANKDRAKSVDDFVKKAHAAVTNGCNLLLVDLFPPGRHDPRGMHGAVWETIDDDDDLVIDAKPLTLASYVAAPLTEAYVEQLAVGDELPAMALFLDRHRHIDTPLEATYMQAYQGVPDFWRDVVEGRRNAGE